MRITIAPSGTAEGTQGDGKSRQSEIGTLFSRKPAELPSGEGRRARFPVRMDSNPLMFGRG